MTSPTLQKRLALRAEPEGRAHVMWQTWRELLFLHWSYPVEEIQKTLPPGLRVDDFEGRAYVGIVPFLMRNVHPRFLPSVPGLSDFLELNLRTYVFDEAGTPGVWFYSLDANQTLAVETAKALFKLPYHRAEMEANQDPATGRMDYRCRRLAAAPDSASRFLYQPCGPVTMAEPGTLDFFLVERYVLFAYDPAKAILYSGRVHHTPYPVRQAKVGAWSDTVLRQAGLTAPGREPEHAAMSSGVDVKIYALEEVARFEN